MTKAFIWEYVDGLTGNYHDGGGAIVFAPDLDCARSALRAFEDVKDDCEAFTKDPTHVIDVSMPDRAMPSVIVFPDAGCC